jgi:bifunctional DNase/RNase
MSLIPFVVTKKSVVFISGDNSVTPILLIKASGINLPFGLGNYEAQQIMALAAGEEPDEHSRDDLVRNMIVLLGASITKIAIVGISNETFFAEISLKKGEEEFSLPAYPSDAVILGMSFKAPMFIEEQVLIDGTSSEGTQDFLSVIFENAPEAMES